MKCKHLIALLAGTAALTGVTCAPVEDPAPPENRGPLVQVRWDNGKETSFVPAAGSMWVEPPEDTGSQPHPG